MAMPLDLPEVCVLRTDLTQEQNVIIEVDSTLTTTMFRLGSRTITEVHGYGQPIELRTDRSWALSSPSASDDGGEESRRADDWAAIRSASGRTHSWTGWPTPFGSTRPVAWWKG
jgi:hypothetical protein